MTTSIDFGPLTAPLPDGQRPTLVPTPRTTSRGHIMAALALLFLGLLSAFAGFGAAIGVLRNSSAGQTEYENVFAPAGIGVASIVVLIVGLRVLRAAISGPLRESMAPRLPAFAAANGLVYNEASPNPSYPGTIFDLPNTVETETRRHIRSSSGRFYDFGDVVTRVSIDSSVPITRSWGFIAIKLDRRLPHMMLKSKREGRLSLALPDDLRRQQTLALEGDFDSWFTLYVPEQYERDALYVFTPDLMALFIDEAAPFDAEIVDDWLFVYSNAPFTALGAEVYERIFRIIDLVGGKTVSQTQHYADERIGNRAENRIAAPGRRLRHNVPATLFRAALLLVCLVAATVAIFYGISLLPGVTV